MKGAWPEGLKKISNALDTKKTNATEQKTVKTEFGKKSLTKFYIEEKMEGFTKMTAIPHTGRTHQIRFHCLDAGYPIVGDKKYFIGTSKSDASRLMLHARQISFKDSGEMVIVSAKEDFGLSKFKTNI